MTNFPGGGYGAPLTSPSALDADDAALWQVDGVIKPVAASAGRGYIDASHYSDVAAQVINTCETITGFVAVFPSAGSSFQLDPAVKTTGANSVMRQVFLTHFSPFAASTYWNAPAPISVGGHVEAAFDLMSSSLDVGTTALRAFVASGVDMTGTVVYADDFTLQFPNGNGFNNIWYTIRIPLQGITSINSIGFTQRDPDSDSGGAQPVVHFDNIVLRAATGIDQAIYNAPPNSYVVIPPGYTSALTQYPIFNEPAGVMWEDRRP